MNLPHHNLHDLRLLLKDFEQHEQEIDGAKNYVILGHTIALSLLNNLDNVGEVIKIKGEKATVIGVFSKEGEDITGNSAGDYYGCNF